jgi:uncharacterized membrane protein YhaH (DUF805 family)
MSSQRRKPTDDEVIMAWPWFGGTPGRVARKIFALWIVALVALMVLTIYAFVTLHLCLAIGLIFVIAVIAVLPSLFLIGSRI